MTLQDTQTPPVLNAIYEQIVNRTITYNKPIWCRSPPTEPKQEQTPTFTGVGTTTSHPEVQLQYCEQELLDSLTQHKLELEEERQHRLRTQRIYSVSVDSQNSLRRQLEVSRTHEGKLQADLRSAEAERGTLKDLIATLEASDAALHADFIATANETREAAIVFDRQSRLVAEKDHVIRSTTKDLLSVRAGLQDAEDKIAQLDTKLHSERDLRIHRTKELLDEQAKSRGRHEAEMRRIAKKAEDVQEQLDLLDDVLLQPRARTQPLLDDAHTPRLRNYAVVIAPDDTGQPPPPPLEPIPDVLTVSLEPITDSRSPFLPKALRQTPERNPHDPTTRHSPDHPRQISACLDRVSDTANSWHAKVESLLETIYRLEAERAREAESRERSKRCLQEELVATKEQQRATIHRLEAERAREAESRERSERCLQGELAATKEQLRATQEEVSNVRSELDRGRETLRYMMAHAGDVKRELETCQVRLKGVQDARRAGIAKFCSAVELLRLRSADLETLRAEVEASRSKHSQAISLSAVLRKRVTILEAEVAHRTDIQTHDSLYMKLSTSLRSLLDSSLPPSPSPSPSPSSNLLPSSSEDPLHTIISLDNVPLNLDPPERPDLSLTRHPPPPFRSPSRTRSCSVAFLPVGSSVGSVDWPPIGSTLRPSGKNAEQDSGVSVRVSETPSGQRATLTNPFPATQKTPQSPLQEADHTPSRSSTSRNPLNLPLAQSSRELTAEQL